MTIRTREDEEYLSLQPKVWQHPSGRLIIGIPKKSGDHEITDTYGLKPEAPVPQTLEDFAELDFRDDVIHLESPSWRTKARSLNTPQWEASQ